MGSTKAFITDEIGKTAEMLKAVVADHGLIGAVEQVADRCVEAIRRGNKILFAGNGGSAADAQHLAAELVGKLNFDRPGLFFFYVTSYT